MNHKGTEDTERIRFEEDQIPAFIENLKRQGVSEEIIQKALEEIA